MNLSLLKPAQRVSNRFGDNSPQRRLTAHRFPIASCLLCAVVLAAPWQNLTAANETSAQAAGLLLVANKGARALGIIDPVAGKQIAVVAEEGVTGHEVAASPDGKRAFVPIYGNAGVGSPGTDGQLLRVIDLSSRKIVGTVEFDKGVRPHCAMFGPKNGLLYVTTELENSVTIIDPQSLQIVGSVPTGQPESHMLAITSDGKRGYTANVGPGTVSALDLEAKKVIAIIPVSKVTQRISLSIDDRWAFTADQTKPQLAVIDTAANKVKTWVALPGVAYGTAPTPDGRFLIVAMSRARKVGEIDLQTMKLTRTLEVPRAPQEVPGSPGRRGCLCIMRCQQPGRRHRPQELEGRKTHRCRPWRRRSRLGPLIGLSTQWTRRVVANRGTRHRLVFG